MSYEQISLPRENLVSQVPLETIEEHLNGHVLRRILGRKDHGDPKPTCGLNNLIDLMNASIVEVENDMPALQLRILGQLCQQPEHEVLEQCCIHRPIHQLCGQHLMKRHRSHQRYRVACRRLRSLGTAGDHHLLGQSQLQLRMDMRLSRSSNSILTTAGINLSPMHGSTEDARRGWLM